MAGPGGQKGVMDALQNVFTDIAKMQLLPDAQQHMQFLQGLQTGIMNYLRMQANATLQAPGGAMGGMGGPGGGVGGMPPGGGAPPPMANAPGGGGGMTGLMGNAPPDDLRRLLAQGAQS